MPGRLVRRVLIRLADLVDDRLFDHRYYPRFCTLLADHPWWDL